MCARREHGLSSSCACVAVPSPPQPRQARRTAHPAHRHTSPRPCTPGSRKALQHLFPGSHRCSPCVVRLGGVVLLWECIRAQFLPLILSRSPFTRGSRKALQHLSPGSLRCSPCVVRPEWWCVVSFRVILFSHSSSLLAPVPQRRACPRVSRCSRVW